MPLTLTQCKFHGKTVCVCTCSVLDRSLGSNYQAPLVCINKSECFVFLIVVVFFPNLEIKQIKGRI